jgi:multiple sugar transport system substrate-binding protein
MNMNRNEKKQDEICNCGKRVTRREALSTAAKIAATAVIVGVVAGVGGYMGGVASAPQREVTKEVTREVIKTVTESVGTAPAATVTVTKTQTVTTTMPATPTPTIVKVPGATPEERVLNGLKMLIEEGKIKPGTTITILTPPGAAAHFDEKYYREFLDAAQGYVKLNVVTAPPEGIFPKLVSESVEKSGVYDIVTVPVIALISEVVEMGVALELDDYIAKYDPELYTGPCPYPEQVQRSAGFYKGKTYGFNIDYDVWLTHYRADIYEDPEIQKEFLDKYGYPLRPPVTWREFRDQAEFFNRPDEPPHTKLNLSDTPGFYSTWEYKVPYWELYNIGLRWWTTGWPFFDREMNPTIEKPEVIKAMKDMLEAHKFQPKESWTSYWDVAYPMFLEGKIAFYISWTSLMKSSATPASKVRGKVKVAFTPGYPIWGDMDQVGIPRESVRTVGYQAASHVMIVNRYSKNPELAYLFAQFFISPRPSTRIVEDPAGYFEPFRMCHFKSKVFEEEWGPEALRVSVDNYDYYAPEIKIPGCPRYQDILDKEMNAAIQGRKSLETAIHTIAVEWNKITEEIGRDKLIPLWNEVLDTCIGPKLKPYLKV